MNLLLSLFAVAMTLLFASPAEAHHLMGGRLPATAFEGFISGLAHPVIGPDHLLALIAVGVICAGLARGARLAAIFALAGLVGTGLHLMRLNLPASELIVAATVVIFGVLVIARSRREGDGAPIPGWLMLLIAVGGVFHGYAYGESIVGAQSGPLLAYLVGFTLIQLAAVLGVRWLVRALSVSMRLAPGDARLRAWVGGTLSLAGAVLVVLVLRR